MPESTIPALEQRLRLAHRARRAREHQLDDIRRALCDAGFMQDDDPYGHADLAEVIRQAELPAPEKPAVDTCGHAGPDSDDPSNPCTLPLGHDLHRDGDGCSWPTPTGPLLDRKAIRDVLLFVSGCVYSMHRDYVEELTDRLFELYCGATAAKADLADVPDADLTPEWREHLDRKATLAPCSINHDCPSQPRPEPTTARGEARCQSQHRPDGGALVQCALAVHPDDTHTDYDPGQAPPGWNPEPPWHTRLTWRDTPASDEVTPYDLHGPGRCGHDGCRA